MDGHIQLRPHAPVTVNPENSERFAAIRFSPARRGRIGIVEVGLDRDRLTGSQVRIPVDREDLGPEFVAEDARIFKKGLPTMEGVDVRATDPDPPDPDASLARSRIGKLTYTNFESTRLDEVDFGLGHLLLIPYSQFVKIRDSFVPIRVSFFL